MWPRLIRGRAGVVSEIEDSGWPSASGGDGSPTSCKDGLAVDGGAGSLASCEDMVSASKRWEAGLCRWRAAGLGRGKLPGCGGRRRAARGEVVWGEIEQIEGWSTGPMDTGSSNSHVQIRPTKLDPISC